MALKARIKELGTKSTPVKLVELDVGGEKVAVELRAPTMAAKGQILRGAGADESGSMDTVDIELLTALALIHCAHEPGGKRVWRHADLDDVMGLGPAFDPLQAAVLELIKPEKDAAGKSEPTPS